MTQPEWKKVALQMQKKEKKLRKNFVSLQHNMRFPQTWKFDFSFPVVRILTALVPVLSTVRFTGMSKVRGTSSMFVMCFSWMFCSLILFVQ